MSKSSFWGLAAALWCFALDGQPNFPQALLVEDSGFIPSGWMGDAQIQGVLQVEVSSAPRPHSRLPHSEQWTYRPKLGRNGWAAVAWQFPASNWGEKPGRDWSTQKFSRVTVWARGVPDSRGRFPRLQFKAGGNTNPDRTRYPYQASFEVESDFVTLTEDWKQYSMDLTGQNLSQVVSAFTVVMSAQNFGPGGGTFYLDEIEYSQSSVPVPNAPAIAARHPLDAREAAIKLISDQGLREARDVIGRMLSASPSISSAYELTYLAELMQRTGDPRAEKTYRKAVGKDADPAIELLFGEYERNFRGPMQPLTREAERHFLEARQKLACMDEEYKGKASATVRNQLHRSIVALYEGDGLPIYSWITKPTPCKARGPGVSIFLSTGVRGGEGVTDLDVDSDVRDFTSAAAYSQSLRLTLGPLTMDLLRLFLRTVSPLENRNRLRVRYKGAHLDFFFNDRHSGDAAITNPNLRDPAPLSNRDLVTYDALKLNEFGTSIGGTFHLSGGTDAALEATYRRGSRTGLVDYLPNAVENINQVEARGAVSRFVGPDKIYGDFTFIHQSISPEDTPYQSRGREIYAGTLRYQIYRLGSGGYSRTFRGTRGLELYTGAMHDHENFGYSAPALVNRQDYFAGATLHGLGRRLDLSIQPTWFTYNVPQDVSRNSRQYRTSAYGMVRLVDEERVGPNLPREWHGWYLGFVHLTIPIQSDTPQQGLSAFANRKVGAELAAKWFTTNRGATTFLGSARYDLQEFTALNRTFSLFTLGLTMGF